MTDLARALISEIAPLPHEESLRQSLSATLGVGRSLFDFVSAVCGASKSLFARLGDEDLEGVFTVLMSLLAGLNPAEQDAATHVIVSALTVATDKPLLRLRIVTNVYNAVDEAQHKESKLEVLKQLIRFAAETRLAELIQPFLAGAAGWPAKWALSAEQAGSLFLLIAQCMERYGNAEEAQVFLIRYLTTLEGASAAMLAEARHWAKAAALNFVKAPAVSQKSNLARLAAVRALEKDPVDARLFELVDIFSHGSLDAYTSYYSRNNAYLKELGVDHEKSVETMRLLTLCSLASANHVASYDVIESALQCRPEEVEEWVVKAISAGLVDGKMSQDRRVATFSRSVQREFSGEQWTRLKDRMEGWVGSVGGMLKAIGGDASP